MSRSGYTLNREAEAAEQNAANLQSSSVSGQQTGITSAGLGPLPKSVYSDFKDPMSRTQLENIVRSEREKLDEAARQIREAAQLVQEAQGEQWQRSLMDLERELQTMEATVQMKQRFADDSKNQLNALIAQRADFFNRQQQLQKRIAMLQQEINNLQHQLNVLNDSKRQCADALSAAEAEALRARTAYETKQTHLAGMQNALAQAQRELQLAQTQAHAAKSQLEELESLAKLGKVQITLSTTPPTITSTGSYYESSQIVQQQTSGFGRTAA